jgi:type I restriction enzyme, S subunit
LRRAASESAEPRGREATTRQIPPKLALAVGIPSTPAPKGWQWAPLQSLARLESGHTPSRQHPEYWGGEIPWISIQDAKANHGGRIHETIEQTNDRGIANSSARVLPENTVCLSRTASVGYVVVMGRPMATSQDFVNWVCANPLVPDFLKYLFIAEGKDLLRFASGAVHQTIYFPEVKAFQIAYPPIREQQRIVAILDEALASVATAKANAERNLQNARALFKSHLEAVFSRPGPSWVERELREIGTTQTGSTPKTSERSNYGDFIPFVKPSDFKTDGSLCCASGGLSRKGLSQARTVPAGSVLMVCIGATIGKCGYTVRDISTNQQINSLTPFKEISHEFIYYQMLSEGFQRRVRLGSGQATLPIINKSRWSALTVVIPPSLEAQRCISTKLRDLCAESERLALIYQQKLLALDAMRKSLLHQAFTGQL